MSIPEYTGGSGTVTFINGNLERGYDRTDFGVRLSTGFGKLSQFCCMDRDNRMKKICAVALTAIALTALITAPLALSLGTSYFLIKLVALNTLPLAVEISAIACSGLLTMVGTWVSSELVYEPFRDEYHDRKQEKKLIQALGGKQVFDQLPTAQLYLDNDNVSLEWLSPTNLENQPITKGFDTLNRPFVSFCLQTNGGTRHVETLYHSFLARRWYNCSDTTNGDRTTAFLSTPLQEVVFNAHESFENNLTRIHTLVSGQEVNGYTFIPANAQID